MDNKRFYDRIDYIDNIDNLSKRVCEEYSLGDYLNTKIIEIGYEDFNIIITTSTGKYFVKVYGNFRNDKEVSEVIERAYVGVENGVKSPKIYKNNEGNIVTNISINNSKFRLSVMECIEGCNFLELGRNATIDELKKIADLASQFSNIDYRPNFIYDTWAISSFKSEYEKKKQYINSEYLKYIEPIFDKLVEFNYDSLPKSFTHGDIILTNVIKDKNDECWIVDYSVSNYMPRVIEIVVAANAFAIIDGNKEESEKRIKIMFERWAKNVNATELERKAFELLFKVQNAIYVLNPSYQIALGNTSDENKKYLEIGKSGLMFNVDVREKNDDVKGLIK